MAESIVATERTLIVLLIVISTVAIAVRRIRLPYTVALVLSGLAIAIFQPFPRFALTSDVILSIFIPPIVFNAAFHLDLDELRDNVGPILVLAVVGVVISTLIIGGIISLGAGLPLTIALTFAALISATDPIAVIAVFRELGVPRRLSHIVEGESLFNDGTSIVLFEILLISLVLGRFDFLPSLSSFFFVTVGGMVLGTGVGFVISQLLRRIDDYLVEITLTSITAYGTYLVAEEIGISGVIAVVLAGVIIGNYGARIGMSPTTRIVLVHFWEYATFIADSFIFLLIGLAVDVPLLMKNLPLIAWAIGAVLVGRAAVIYGLGTPLNHFTGRLSAQWRHVLFWGGLRGAIALALALALPAAVGNWRNPLRAMTFGVVLFTLLVQGTTIQWLLGRLGLSSQLPRRKEYELARARLYATQAAWRRIRQLSQDGVLSPSVWNELNAEYHMTEEQLSNEIHTLYEEREELRREEMLAARSDALRAERIALQDLLRQGLLSEGTYRELVGEVDRRREALRDGT
ncbi:MAG: Na+/H+ antiporter [Ardenticatenaceae bacterium]|nr:Na+/H+ antiporter [Ardenticatenaceae bacterium]